MLSSEDITHTRTSKTDIKTLRKKEPPVIDCPHMGWWVGKKAPLKSFTINVLPSKGNDDNNKTAEWRQLCFHAVSPMQTGVLFEKKVKGVHAGKGESEREQEREKEWEKEKGSLSKRYFRGVSKRRKRKLEKSEGLSKKKKRKLMREGVNKCRYMAQLLFQPLGLGRLKTRPKESQ